MQHSFRLYAALAREKLSQLLDRLSAQELHYIGGSDPLPAPLSPEEELALVTRLPHDGAAVRGTLIEHNLRLVAHIVKKYYTAARDQEDLVSVGTVGLIKAIDSFDIDNGARFATYAGKCLQNEIAIMY